MDTRLQAYLDGEIGLEELPEELRGHAAAWETLLEDVRATAPGGAPPGLDARVMEGISAGSRRRPAWLDWLLRPRPVLVSPLTAAAAIVALLLVAVRPWSDAGPGSEAVSGRVYVQFVVSAPSARSVDLVGDFNDWQPTVSLEDPDGDGVWSARVPLKPGVHEYMFLIDGSSWMTDPNASSFNDDGFGQRNAVLAVGPVNGT